MSEAYVANRNPGATPSRTVRAMRARGSFAVAISLLALLAGPTAAAAPPPQSAQQRQMKAIVRAWTKRLNAGDNAGVARLFSLPATIIQGPYVYRLTTRAQIARWHAGLPCSGRILSIAYRGNFATAVFRLANRGSHPCDAPGTLAAARFKIVDRKIASWEQVAVPPQASDTQTA